MTDTSAPASYLSRVVSSTSLRKGVAALATGVLIAAITEAIWPSI